MQVDFPLIRSLPGLYPFFCEANETISSSLSAADTSFVNERNETHDENEGLSYSESENPAEYSGDETQIVSCYNFAPSQFSNCSVSLS